MSIGPAEPDDLDSCLASSSVVAMVTPSSGLQVVGAQEAKGAEVRNEQSREEGRTGQDRRGERKMQITSIKKEKKKLEE